MKIKENEKSNILSCLLIPFYTNVETISEDEQYDFTVLHLNAKWNKKIP